MDNHVQYVAVQAEAAVRHLATCYPYDAHQPGQTSLRVVQARWHRRVSDQLRRVLPVPLEVAVVPVEPVREFRRSDSFERGPPRGEIALEPRVARDLRRPHQSLQFAAQPAGRDAAQAGRRLRRLVELAEDLLVAAVLLLQRPQRCVVEHQR